MRLWIYPKHVLSSLVLNGGFKMSSSLVDLDVKIYPVVKTNPVGDSIGLNRVQTEKGVIFSLDTTNFPFISKFQTVLGLESPDYVVKNVKHTLNENRLFISWDFDPSWRHMEIVYWVESKGLIFSSIVAGDAFFQFPEVILDGDRFEVFLQPVSLDGVSHKLAANARTYFLRVATLATTELVLSQSPVSVVESNLRLPSDLNTYPTDISVGNFSGFMVGSDLYLTWDHPNLSEGCNLLDYTIEVNLTGWDKSRSVITERVSNLQQYFKVKANVAAPFSYTVAIYTNVDCGLGVSRFFSEGTNLLRISAGVNSSSVSSLNLAGGSSYTLDSSLGSSFEGNLGAENLNPLGYSEPPASFKEFVPEFLRETPNLIQEVNALIYNTFPVSSPAPSKSDLASHLEGLPYDSRELVSALGDPFLYKKFFGFKATDYFFDLVLKFFGIELEVSEPVCTPKGVCPNVVDLRVKNCPSQNDLKQFVAYLRENMALVVKLVAVSNTARPSLLVLNCSKLGEGVLSSHMGYEVDGVLFYCLNKQTDQVLYEHLLDLIAIRTAGHSQWVKHNYFNVLGEMRLGVKFIAFDVVDCRTRIQDFSVLYSMDGDGGEGTNRRTFTQVHSLGTLYLGGTGDIHENPQVFMGAMPRDMAFRFGSDLKLNQIPPRAVPWLYSKRRWELGDAIGLGGFDFVMGRNKVMNAQMKLPWGMVLGEHKLGDTATVWNCPKTARTRYFNPDFEYFLANPDEQESLGVRRRRFKQGWNFGDSIKLGGSSDIYEGGSFFPKNDMELSAPNLIGERFFFPRRVWVGGHTYELGELVPQFEKSGKWNLNVNSIRNTGDYSYSPDPNGGVFADFSRDRVHTQIEGFVHTNVNSLDVSELTWEAPLNWLGEVSTSSNADLVARLNDVAGWNGGETPLEVLAETEFVLVQGMTWESNVPSFTLNVYDIYCETQHTRISL